MNIIGEKTILRAITMSDAPFLNTLINDPETEKMLGGHSFPVSMEAQEKWIAEQMGKTNILRCVIADKRNQSEGLGTVILSDIDTTNGVAQIHIKMDVEKGRGKGYGTDAVRSMVRYAFDTLRLHCVYAEILEYNIPSQKLFQKCGFTKDGVLRARAYKNGKYVDVFSYSILSEEQNQA